MLSRAMADDDGALDAANEPLLPLGSAPRAAASKKKRIARWLVFGALALVVLVALHALAKIPVRKIATGAMRDADMEITSMRLSDPHATAVTLRVELAVRSPSAFAVQLDATQFSLLYRRGDSQEQQQRNVRGDDDNDSEFDEVGALLAPAMEIHAGNNSVAFPDAPLTIANRSAWDAFAHDMIQQPEVSYKLVGSLTIHIRLLWGIIAFDLDAVPLSKVMRFRGMDGMKQMRVIGINMASSTATQVVAKIRACLYNPSIMAIAPVGKLCLRAHYPTVGAQTLVANLATSENASIDVGHSDRSHPDCASATDLKDGAFGYNLLELEGEMLGTNQDAISGLISNYLSNTPSALTVVSCDPQATSVDIYNRAMQNLTIPAILPPQKDPLVGRMFFNGIALGTPSKGKENTHVGLNTAVVVEAMSPLGPNSALILREVHMTVKLFARKRLDEVYLGELSTLKVDILNGRLVERSNITVNCSTDLLLDKKGAAFGDFVRDSVVKDVVELRLEGHLNVVADGALNELKLSGLPLDITTTLLGMNNFHDVTIKALVGLKISTSFPGVAPGFQLINGINMTRLDVTLIEDKAAKTLTTGLPRWTNTKMLIRTSLHAQVKMPPSIQIPLNIANVSIALAMKNEERHPLGSLVSSRETCEFNQSDGGSFRLNMSRFYPIAFGSDDEITEMASFVEDLLTKQSGIVMRLASDVKAHQGAFPFVETRMGMLSLQNIPIEGASVIPGMNSFRDPPVKILGVDIERGLPSSMTLKMKFSITNPSIVQTALGTLRFNVLFENTRMGVAEIKGFSLKCCGEETVLSGQFELKPAARDIPVAQRFLSNFVSGYFTDGNPQKIEIQGSSESSTLDILQPALKTLTIPSSLPTLANLFPAMPTLVTSSVLYTPSIFHLSQIPTALKLQNPFSENITVTAVDLQLYPCEDQAKVDGVLVCTKYYANPLARFAPAQISPMFVPASSNGCFSCCQGARCEEKMKVCPRGSVGECMRADVGSFFSPEAIAALFRSATSGLLMKVNGTIGASIGEYPARLWYQQEGLLVGLASSTAPISMDDIRALAAHSPRPLSLQQMKSFADAGDKLRLVSAKFLHAELQVRFARAIMELSDLPIGLSHTESVQLAVAVYCNELRLLRSMEPPTTAAKDLAFTEAISAAKDRGTNLVPLICSGLQEIKQTDLGSNALQLVSVQEDIMHRLDTFFLARIGIRMLIGQHVESLTQVGGRVELVNVEETVRSASARAAELCRLYCGQAPAVEIHAAVNVPAPFVYVESHLHHMVFELVKNSMRATVEYHEGLQHKQPGGLNRLERVMNPLSKGLDFALPD
ncbi:hypothetical protein PybrP1_003937, partial [[Pythium] brassicae (nom. inval.)]